MPRQPRLIVPGLPQHVIQRGNNRVDIFAVPTDYRGFLERLRSASEQHGCRVHAYVLMSNHFHLLITPLVSAGIGRMMQSVGTWYVRYFNNRYGRTGTLWEGRYRSAP